MMMHRRPGTGSKEMQDIAAYYAVMHRLERQDGRKPVGGRTVLQLDDGDLDTDLFYESDEEAGPSAQRSSLRQHYAELAGVDAVLDHLAATSCDWPSTVANGRHDVNKLSASSQASAKLSPQFTGAWKRRLDRMDRMHDRDGFLWAASAELATSKFPPSPYALWRQVGARRSAGSHVPPPEQHPPSCSSTVRYYPAATASPGALPAHQQPSPPAASASSGVLPTHWQQQPSPPGFAPVMLQQVFIPVSTPLFHSVIHTPHAPVAQPTPPVVPTRAMRRVSA